MPQQIQFRFVVGVCVYLEMSKNNSGCNEASPIGPRAVSRREKLRPVR